MPGAAASVRVRRRTASRWPRHAVRRHPARSESETMAFEGSSLGVHAGVPLADLGARASVGVKRRVHLLELAVEAGLGRAQRDLER